MKHFLKTLIIFTGMILLGLLGVYLISYFDGSDTSIALPFSNQNIVK